MTFEESFQEIKNSKDKFRISNLLGELQKKEPDYTYLEEIKKLSNHRTSEIKWGALKLLANFNLPEDLEDLFLERVNNESDNMTLAIAVHGFRLNGTEKAIDSLFNLFKKSRDGHVRGNIISSMRSIYLRNKLSEYYIGKIHDFIGNKYSYFHGYWTDIKKATIVTDSTWRVEATRQLQKNSLNLLITHDNEIDIQIHIEKMNSHFIRYVYVTAIHKNYTYSLSKYYTPSEFSVGEQRLFDVILDREKTMRPDRYVDKLISLLDTEMLPILRKRIQSFDGLKNLGFSDFKSRENEIYNELYGTSWDFVVSHQLTNSIDLFNNNADKNDFIDLVISKWKALENEEFAVVNYLEEQKNSR
jgi:hypothetical protein